MTNIDQSIGPGFLGFIAIFVLVLATVFLLRSFTKHTRKARHEAAKRGLEKGSGAVDGEGSGDVVADEAGDR